MHSIVLHESVKRHFKIWLLTAAQCYLFKRDTLWGLLSQFPPFRYFPNFSALSKQTLAIEYHVYISQVSPQLSCGDICQIWMWFEKSYMYFCHIENFAYGENNERSFSNPPSQVSTPFPLAIRPFQHHQFAGIPVYVGIMPFL